MSMGAFERHLREAIAINTERTPRYARITAGRSNRISRLILLSEHAILPFASLMDRWAGPFQARGVPVLEEDLIEMSGTPAFSEHYLIDPGPSSRVGQPSGNKIAAGILKAYRAGGFQAASRACEVELEKLEEVPGFQVMLRHILESARRVANHAPLHEEHRKKLGLGRSTLPLSKCLFFSHFSSFTFATLVDRMAFPLQCEGVPILFQDIPRIPPFSEHLILA